MQGNISDRTTNQLAEADFDDRAKAQEFTTSATPIDVANNALDDFYDLLKEGVIVHAKVVNASTDDGETAPDCEYTKCILSLLSAERHVIEISCPATSTSSSASRSEICIRIPLWTVASCRLRDMEGMKERLSMVDPSLSVSESTLVLQLQCPATVSVCRDASDSCDSLNVMVMTTSEIWIHSVKSESTSVGTNADDVTENDDDSDDDDDESADDLLASLRYGLQAAVKRAKNKTKASLKELCSTLEAIADNQLRARHSKGNASALCAAAFAQWRQSVVALRQEDAWGVTSQ